MRKRVFLLLAVAMLMCLFAISVSAQEHILQETYTYDNGFTEKGVYTAVCSCQSADCAVNEEKAPLFKINGFSSFVDGTTVKGLCYGYLANVELIKEYERVNNSKISYGFLAASAINYKLNNDKIVIVESGEYYQAVDVRVNYDITEDSDLNEYDKYDVIFAGSVTETKDGNKKTSYFQPKLPTNLYSNEVYGDLYGISYDVVAKKQNSLMTWYNNKGISEENGLVVTKTNTSFSKTYIKIKPGDKILIPESSGVVFKLYGYNREANNTYSFAGYINESWVSSHIFGNEDVINLNGELNEIDYNEFYVRIECVNADGSATAYGDFASDIIYNIVEEPIEYATVTFKNGDTVVTKECIIGNKLGKLPEMYFGNYVLLGWHEEGDSSKVYDDSTIIKGDVTLVPSLRLNFTDLESYLVWAQAKINDTTGGYIATDASSYIISSLIKVNAGDTISIPSNNGHKFTIYCYSDPYGSYEPYGIIDCNPNDETSSVENWGYTYTFKNGDILVNGKELNCDNLYVRVAFRKDDGGKNGSTDPDSIRNNISLNITADNYHLVIGGTDETVGCAHSFGDWTVLQERDCYVDGSDVRTCTLCGKREVRYTQSVGHKVVIDEAVAADCLKEGLTEGAHCSVCGYVLKEQNVIPTDGFHNYAELVTLTTTPTESSTGKGTFKCVLCGDIREEIISKVTTGAIGADLVANITAPEGNPALDNLWNVFDGNKVSGGLYGAGNDWFGYETDTLTITLKQEVTLTRFDMYILGNYTFARVTIKNAKGDVVRSDRVKADNTDTKLVNVFAGQKLQAYTIEITIEELKWNNNPYTFKIAEIEMTGTYQDARLPHTHYYNTYVRTTTDPTCQSTGISEYECYCGARKEVSIPKIDHNYSQLVSTQVASCVEGGVENYKCATCTATQQQPLAAKGHTFAKLVQYISQPTSAKNGEAIFKCVDCDVTNTLGIEPLPLGKVEYLRVSRIANNTVIIRFNVYGEVGNFEIRYSTSEITEDNFESATLMDAAVKGDKEYYASLSLSPRLNNYYYVAVRPYIGENYGEVVSIRVGGDKLIPIDYHSGNVYHGELLNSFAKLFDEQNENRVIIPTSTLPRLITDTGDSVLYNMDLRPIVDLEYMHYVSKTYLYFATAGVNVTVRWSDTPVDAYADNSAWDGYKTVESVVGWNEFNVSKTTRYIQIIFQDGSAPAEMLVYGYQNGEGDEIATEIGSLPTIGEMMGMCGFVAGGGGNTPIDSVVCTTVLREYHNFGWSYSLTAYPNKASFFNSSWMGNFDKQYQDYKRAGINVIPCVQWDLVNISQSNKVDENNLPIKSNGSFVKGDFWDKMNPHTYFMYADSMFAFSARYGTNNSTELLNTLALHASDTNKVGLNALEWIEMGNEPEGSWNGIHNYYSAYQLAALTSAAYDGHCRTMTSTAINKGYHLGVKNADPNMKAAMAGVSAVSNEYITALCYWMKANREDRSVALDAFNVHCYMTKQITLPNGGTAYVGVSPEEAGIVNTLSQLIKIRDKYYPEKEVWITEFGWDTNQSYATSTSSHAYSNEETGVSYTGREVQAMWLTRTYLLLSAAGIDKATMYMCEDCGVDTEAVGKYGSAGVIGYRYDENGNMVEYKKDSYYYLYTLKNTLGNYTFNKQIEAYDENVMIYEYKTAEGKTAYAVWCPTSDGTVVNNYQLLINSNSATIVENENGNIYGKKTDVKSDSLGYISVNVSEKPVYVVVD